MAGGSAKGDCPLSEGPIGETTVVASAKRAVRGLFSEEPEDDPEELRATGAGAGVESD